MKSASSVLTWAAVISIGLAAVAGGTLGVRVARDGSAPGVDELVIVDPNLFSGPPGGSYTSPGGFSGFGSVALGGEVLGSGQLLSVDTEAGAGTLVISSGSRELTVRFRSTLRLYELVGIDELSAGDTVVVRSVDGTATSILRVPLDAAEETGATP